MFSDTTRLSLKLASISVKTIELAQVRVVDVDAVAAFQAQSLEGILTAGVRKRIRLPVPRSPAAVFAILVLVRASVDLLVRLAGTVAPSVGRVLDVLHTRRLVVLEAAAKEKTAEIKDTDQERSKASDARMRRISMKFRATPETIRLSR